MLVVDDYEPFCDMLRTALEQAGFRAATAASGGEALARAAAAGGFDVALVDLGLPDRPGLEVAAELTRRGHVGCSVLMSGSPVQGLEWPTEWVGERDVLLKPYALDDLLRRLDAAVASSRHEEEARRAPRAAGE